MKYYKNTELANIYHVSEKSVRNWIDATLSSKLDLELHEINDRHYIANTTKNLDIIKSMVEERKKFTNSRAHKVVSPKPEFYELYTEEQILDIITNIDTHREIPLKYSYFNGGAVYWEEYIQKLLKETTPNPLSSSIKLIELNQNYIDTILDGNKVNIVDLCIGDGMPAMKLLTHLHEKNQINRYVGIDFSKDMLDIATQNVRQWFGNAFNFETHSRDLNYDRFEDVLRKDILDGDKPINVVLLLGGTLTNFKDPDLALRIVNASMGRDDYLIYSRKLDTEASRRYFDFYLGDDSQKLAARHALLPNLLGIDEALYEVEQFFDQTKKARFIQIKFKLDTTIDFLISGQQKQLSIRKGETVLIWRAWHQSSMDVINQFDQNGFDLLQASLTENKEYLLTISKVKMGINT